MPRPPLVRGGGSASALTESFSDFLTFQPAHHAAQLCAHLLDGVLGLHTALSEEVDLAATVGAHLGQELGSEGAILDLGQDLLHLLAGLSGNEALAGAVVAVLSGVGDGVTHLGEAALVDEVNDELHLVASLEVGHLGLVASLDQSIETSVDELADAAAQDSLLRRTGRSRSPP